jgi:two-component system, LytTR family, sensor kinase
MKFYHLILWGLLFAGWYFFRIADFPNGLMAVKITLVKVLTLACLVYLTNYLLVPNLLYKKKYALFGILYLSLIFGIGLLKIYINERILATHFKGIDVFSDFKERIYDNIIPLFLLTTTGVAIKLVSDHLKSQRRLSEISKEKAETELKFLKSQINPHFLFNSLNSIYFLIDKQNSEARRTLLQFSDLLRYQLYECNAETIEVEKEVAYLMDYIRLQQIRKSPDYEVQVKSVDINGFRIAPLLLIPFVENAFKHISHYSGQKNYINVEIAKENGTFQFRVENSKEEHRISTEPEGGIGLVNVTRRLELLYPGKHELHIHNSATNFKIELNLHFS